MDRAASSLFRAEYNLSNSPQAADLFSGPSAQADDADNSRVLAGVGDRPAFDLRQNPFILLGLSLTAPAAAVKAACDDAIEDGLADAALLQRAQQILLTPRLRLEAEIGGMVGAEAPVATRILSALGDSDALTTIAPLLDQLAPLSRSNVMAHLGATRPLDATRLRALLQAQMAIDVADVHALLKDARSASGVGSVDQAALREAVDRLVERQSRAVIGRLGTSDEAIACFEQFASSIIGNGDTALILALDVWIQSYRQAIAPELSRRTDAVTAALDAVRSEDNPSTALTDLKSALEHWWAAARPLQSYETARHREDPLTWEMVGKIRELCLGLSNDQGDCDRALLITGIVHGVFTQPPGVVAQLEGDLAALQRLCADKQAAPYLDRLATIVHELQLTPLELAQDLIRSGFGAYARGDALRLFTAFSSAVEATADASQPDAPWISMRPLTIILGEKDQWRAIEILLEGLLACTAGDRPLRAHREAMEQDLEFARSKTRDHEVLRRLQSEDLAGARKLLDREIASNPDPQARANLAATRKQVIEAQKTSRWWRAFWVLLILLGIGRAAVDRQTSTPSRNIDSAERTATQAVSPGSKIVAPAPWPEEKVPRTSLVVILTQPELRYCVFESIRLDAAKRESKAQIQRDRLQSDVAQFNQRCINRRYHDRDKLIVEAEADERLQSLQSAGRARAASWLQAAKDRP